MENIIQAVINGLFLGGIYGLIAIGLTLPFGVLDIPNFAHGEFVMLAMYATFFIWQFLGLDPLFSLPIVIVLFFFVGLIVYQVILRRLFAVNAPTTARLLAFAGLSIFLLNVAMFKWGTIHLVLKTSYWKSTLDMGPYIIRVPMLISFIGSIVLTLLVLAFLNKTYTGKGLMATAQDPDAATLMGINNKRMYMICFGLGIALAAGAAPFLTTFQIIFPTVGNGLTLIAFVIVIMGGLGSVTGAYIGGLVIGVIESVISLVFTPELAWVTIFIVFIAILLYKPKGFFGKWIK
ncbi:MAG: branched-chain amino acid ABC transporter permease [Deltaproteobacteria bacterium]|nr:branched-chain amino acid ABC transporter permease [Deltaproteobacteria bacterium]